MSPWLSGSTQRTRSLASLHNSKKDGPPKPSKHANFEENKMITQEYCHLRFVALAKAHLPKPQGVRDSLDGPSQPRQQSFISRDTKDRLF